MQPHQKRIIKLIFVHHKRLLFRCFLNCRVIVNVIKRRTVLVQFIWLIGLQILALSRVGWRYDCADKKIVLRDTRRSTEKFWPEDNCFTWWSIRDNNICKVISITWLHINYPTLQFTSRSINYCSVDCRYFKSVSILVHCPMLADKFCLVYTILFLSETFTKWCQFNVISFRMLGIWLDSEWAKTAFLLLWNLSQSAARRILKVFFDGLACLPNLYNSMRFCHSRSTAIRSDF